MDHTTYLKKEAKLSFEKDRLGADFLMANGWKSSSSLPGSMWLWFKSFPESKIQWKWKGTEKVPNPTFDVAGASLDSAIRIECTWQDLYADKHTAPAPAQPAAAPPYGFCPMCFAPGVSRERGLDGNDRCEGGHVYKSCNALDAKSVRPVAPAEPVAPAKCSECGSTSADSFAGCKITQGVRCPMGRLEFAARGVD